MHYIKPFTKHKLTQNPLLHLVPWHIHFHDLHFIVCNGCVVIIFQKLFQFQGHMRRISCFSHARVTGHSCPAPSTNEAKVHEGLRFCSAKQDNQYPVRWAKQRARTPHFPSLTHSLTWDSCCDSAKSFFSGEKKYKQAKVYVTVVW